MSKERVLLKLDRNQRRRKDERKARPGLGHCRQAGLATRLIQFMSVSTFNVCVSLIYTLAR